MKYITPHDLISPEEREQFRKEADEARELLEVIKQIRESLPTKALTLSIFGWQVIIYRKGRK